MAITLCCFSNIENRSSYSIEVASFCSPEPIGKENESRMEILLQWCLVDLDRFIPASCCQFIVHANSIVFPFFRSIAIAVLLSQKWTDCQIPDAKDKSSRPTDTKVVQGRHEFFLWCLIDFDELAFKLQVRVGWDCSLVPLVAVSLVGRDFDGSLPADLHSLQTEQYLWRIQHWMWPTDNSSTMESRGKIFLSEASVDNTK